MRRWRLCGTPSWPNRSCQHGSAASTSNEHKSTASPARSVLHGNLRTRPNRDMAAHGAEWDMQVRAPDWFLGDRTNTLLGAHGARLKPALAWLTKGKCVAK